MPWEAQQITACSLLWLRWKRRQVFWWLLTASGDSNKSMSNARSTRRATGCYNGWHLSHRHWMDIMWSQDTLMPEVGWQV